MTQPFHILAVSDFHFTDQAPASPLAARQGRFGSIFLRKALHRLKMEGQPVDLIVILGDLVDQGLDPNAGRDLDSLGRTIQKLGVPALVIPGNHDRGPGGAVHPLFTPPGLHEIGGYGFWVFHDPVGEDDVTTRTPESLKALESLAAQRPDLPLIALQHNPVAPPIESSYPFMLTNEKAVLKTYAKAGVCLSLSGHFHIGQPPCRLDTLLAFTVPAICEAPFRFSHIRIEGRDVRITDHHLRMDVPGLVDTHCHTEYSYCSTSSSAEACTAVSQVLGMGGLGLVDHSYHLYFDKSTAWSWRWFADEELVRQAWTERTGRMDAYRAAARAWKSPFVQIGLELDLRKNGDLMLAPADRSDWDLLVGAVHVLQGFKKGVTPQKEAEALFMEQTVRVLEQPIHVLAHPFRFFRLNGLDVPTHLFEPLAELLARRGVAAEVNYHANQPDPRFFEICSARGVKIALGTDSHDLVEAGELTPHLHLLEAAGITPDRFERTLFAPPVLRQ